MPDLSLALYSWSEVSRCICATAFHCDLWGCWRFCCLWRNYSHHYHASMQCYIRLCGSESVFRVLCRPSSSSAIAASSSSLVAATNVTSSLLPPLSSGVISPLPVSDADLSALSEQLGDPNQYFTGLSDDSMTLDCAGNPLAQPEVTPIDSDSDNDDDVTLLPPPTPDVAAEPSSPDVEVIPAPPPSVKRKPKRTARMNANSRVAVGSKLGIQKVIAMRRGRLRLSVPGRYFCCGFVILLSSLLVYRRFWRCRGRGFRSSFTSGEEGCADFHILSYDSSEFEGCSSNCLWSAAYLYCNIFAEEDCCRATARLRNLLPRSRLRSCLRSPQSRLVASQLWPSFFGDKSLVSGC